MVFEEYKNTACPICGHIGWCSSSNTDKNLEIVVCRRESRGQQARLDKNGSPYWVHKIANFTKKNEEVQEKPPVAVLADPEMLNSVYQFLLRSLPLSNIHKQNLHNRGLSEQEILKRNYGSLPNQPATDIASKIVSQFGEKICQQVPGLVNRFTTDGKLYWTLAFSSGMLIPVRDKQFRIIALKIRTDDKHNLPKYLYLTSSKNNGPGTGAPLHCPLRSDGSCSPKEKIRITEGELKADVTTALSSIWTVSIPGVSMWRLVFPLLHEIKPSVVCVAFDKDAYTNPTVARSLTSFIKKLKKDNFKYGINQW
jgi:DNA primase